MINGYFEHCVFLSTSYFLLIIQNIYSVNKFTNTLSPEIAYLFKYLSFTTFFVSYCYFYIWVDNQFFQTFYKLHEEAFFTVSNLFFRFLSFALFFYFTRICLHTTQNIVFCVLKPVPLNPQFAKLLRWKKSDPSEHETYHNSLTYGHLTTS